MDLHRIFKYYFTNNKSEQALKMMRTFENSDDINELKTVLLVTKHLKDDKRFSEIYASLNKSYYDIYDKL